MFRQNVPKVNKGGRPTGTTLSRKRCDPFQEIDDKKVVLRLLAGKFEKKDLDAYYKTDWFIKLKIFATEVYGSCVLCNTDKNLQLHHRHYKSLFDENISKDLTMLCAKHHNSFHRSRGGGRRR